MLFHDFSRPEGFEPYTRKYCKINWQTLSEFRSKPADFYEKTFTKFERLFCLMSRKCDVSQNGLFSFLWKGRDSHVADILLKRKNKIIMAIRF